MVKLTRKQKIELQKEQRDVEKAVVVTETNTKKSRLFMHLIVIVVLLLIGLGVYFNSLDNQLTLVDDIQGFVYDENIKDLVATVKSLSIQKTVYAISYHFFQYNPLPLRIVSLALHLTASILVYFFVYLLFDQKKAIIASLVFLVHPINTEASTWISGSPYLYTGLFNLLIFLFYLLFKKSNKSKYIYLSVMIVLYILQIILLRSPWVLVTPMALVVLDQFFFEKKLNIKKLWWVILLLIPIGVYLATVFPDIYANRLNTRSEGGTRITINTQSFIPVVQGYPYTTYLMSGLYLFPKNLSVYYDGMAVTPLLYLSMYTAFIAYVSLIIYFWKRNRKLTGLLIILPILIAPAYSPIKITWFLAERYLYTGTAFFAIMVALLFEKLESKWKNKFFIYGAFGLLLIIYSVRTIMRNNDWQDTETLAYATMKASPLSVRPYNDVGGHYFMKGDIKKAVAFYEKGLTVIPTSGTAISNLGYIYIQFGPLIYREDYAKPTQDANRARDFFDYAKRESEKNSDIKTISFFLNRALALDMEQIEYNLNVAEFYFELGNYEDSKKLFERSLAIDPNNQYALKRLNDIELALKSN